MQHTEAGPSWKGLPPTLLAQVGIERVGELVYVPYFAPDGSLHNRRIFGDQKTWWETKDQRLLPYGLERLRPNRNHLMIAEGESDALALYADFKWGYDVLGLPGASTWKKSWLLHILGAYELVYVLPDGDLAGEKLARRVYEDMPEARIVQVPDGRDARSLLQWQGPAIVQTLLEEADHAARERIQLNRFYDLMMLSATIEDCEALIESSAE